MWRRGESRIWVQGRGAKNWGGKPSADGARIEAHGVRNGEAVCPFSLGAVFPPENFLSFLGLEMRTANLNICFLHCNTSRSRPPVCLLSQSDITGWLWLNQSAGIPAEEGTEHYLPWSNLIIANVETLSHDDSYSHRFSSDGHEFGGHGPLAPSGSATDVGVGSCPRSLQTRSWNWRKSAEL